MWLITSPKKEMEKKEIGPTSASAPPCRPKEYPPKQRNDDNDNNNRQKYNNNNNKQQVRFPKRKRRMYDGRKKKKIYTVCMTDTYSESKTTQAAAYVSFHIYIINTRIFHSSLIPYECTNTVLLLLLPLLLLPPPTSSVGVLILLLYRY